MENREASGPGRTELFAGLKNEIIEQGLSVSTPEELKAFQGRIRGFVMNEDAPTFLRWEALQILDTQTIKADVRAVVRDLKEELRGQQTTQAIEDRIAEAEDMTRFAADAEDPKKVEEMIHDFEAFLASSAEKDT